MRIHCFFFDLAFRTEKYATFSSCYIYIFPFSSIFRLSYTTTAVGCWEGMIIFAKNCTLGANHAPALWRHRPLEEPQQIRLVQQQGEVMCNSFLPYISPVGQHAARQSWEPEGRSWRRFATVKHGSGDFGQRLPWGRVYHGYQHHRALPVGDGPPRELPRTPSAAGMKILTTLDIGIEWWMDAWDSKSDLRQRRPHLNEGRSNVAWCTYEGAKNMLEFRAMVGVAVLSPVTRGRPKTLQAPMASFSILENWLRKHVPLTAILFATLFLNNSDVVWFFPPHVLVHHLVISIF